MTYIDLILDNNQLVRIEAPDEVEDELYEAIDNAIKQQCSWSTNMFRGCRATLNGLMINRVYMNRVVGML